MLFFAEENWRLLLDICRTDMATGPISHSPDPSPGVRAIIWEHAHLQHDRLESSARFHSKAGQLAVSKSRIFQVYYSLESSPSPTTSSLTDCLPM